MRTNVFFGVFDGHCGSGASLWCSKNIHKYLDELTNFNDENIINTIIEADREFLTREDSHMGTTAVMALIDLPEDEENDRDITIINVGDSRCIIGRKNSDFQCMTTDHKPENKSEEQRIVKAGGFVAKNRVEGHLSVSRSIGDSGYKSDKDLPVEEQKIIPVPDITHETVSTDDFLLLCCDGIFETAFTNETATDFIRNYLRNNDDPAFVVSKLVEEALHLGSKDNLTAILIQFKDGSNYGREPEFIPGQWHDNGNQTFVQAYKDFAEKCGYSLEEAKAMWESRPKTNNTNTNTNQSNNNGSLSREKPQRGLLNIKNLNIS